jgi:hypothetical protein
MCSLPPLTCSQVQVLSRPRRVGRVVIADPDWGETRVGASSAANGRAYRRRFRKETHMPSSFRGSVLPLICLRIHRTIETLRPSIRVHELEETERVG